MTNKLGHFKEESVATKIHEYLSQLPGVSFKDADKEPVIGYYRENKESLRLYMEGVYNRSFYTWIQVIQSQQLENKNKSKHKQD